MRAWVRRFRWLPLLLLLIPLMGARSGCSVDTGSIAGVGHHRERAYARRVFHNDAAEQRCLVALWSRESGWNPDAVEDTSINGQPPTYAYGIPQANPSTWGHPFELGDWKAQIRWGRWYIKRRYGDPCTAWDNEEADGYY